MVTLILADGLPAKLLGPYGNSWIPTPNLDRLAISCVVFDRHLVDLPGAPWNRVVHSFPPADPRTIPTARDALQVHSISLLPPWSPSDEALEAAFDDWDLEEPPEPWLDPEPGFIDPQDVLGWERLQRTFAAVIRDFDTWLADHLDAESLLIVTSTGGQNLGEHGMIGTARPWLYQELVHVPLLIRLPEGAQAGRRVAHLTQPVDIVPTMLDFWHQPVHSASHGRSLLPLCRGGGPIRDYAVTGCHLGNEVEFALETPTEKLIVSTDAARGPLYFIKPDDQWEVNNVRQAHLDHTERLEVTLRNYVAATSAAGPLIPPPLPPHQE